MKRTTYADAGLYDEPWPEKQYVDTDNGGILGEPNKDPRTPIFHAMGWHPDDGVRVNLASGLDYRQGWINIDKHAPKADVWDDLFNYPWALPSNEIDHVLASHILEHVPPRIQNEDGAMLFLNECHRILRPGGYLCIITPYGGSKNDYYNIVHYRSFIPETLGFLWGLHGHEPTTLEAGGAKFDLVACRVRRWLGWSALNTIYHWPKYFNKDYRGPGRKWEIVWILKKRGTS